MIKNNQNIFDFTLENFGTLENLFTDVLVPNSLAIDQEIKPNQEINIDTFEKGNQTIKKQIQEKGLILTNGDLETPPLVAKILITMDMSTPSTAGISLRFASGALNIDWKEGGGMEAFTTDVELTHTYTTPATYIAEITGNLETITQIAADNSKITNIENIKSSLVAIRLNNNLISILDFSLTSISGLLWAFDMASLNTITFANSGNGILTNVALRNTSLASLDFSNVGIGGVFVVHTISTLTNITFSNSGNSVLTLFKVNNCNLGSLDLSNNPVSSIFYAYLNPNLTGINFATSGNGSLSDFKVNNCNLSSLDLSNNPVSSIFFVYSNPNLTGINFATSGNGVLTVFLLRNCDLPNIDFSVFPTSDNVLIEQQNNSMTSTEVDNQLINLDATGWINGSDQLDGTNAARTSASDTAYNNLITKGWTIFVN